MAPKADNAASGLPTGVGQLEKGLRPFFILRWVLNENAFLVPQSFFARIILLVLSVVLFSKALTLAYLMLNEEMLVDRQYTHGAALTLRAYWAADESQRDQIAAATGLREAPSMRCPKRKSIFPTTGYFFSKCVPSWGPTPRIRLRMRGQSAPGLRPVIGGKLGDGAAVSLSPERRPDSRCARLVFGIGLLSTAAAWIFVGLLNAPFKRLVEAARQFGQGRSIGLPVSDSPHEMAEVYRAFNQMAEDVERAAREREELMLAGVSHDLRTPLTRMRLAIEFMRGDAELAADMVRDIEDMDAILDQFLAFIRDGSDGHPLSRWICRH